MPVAPQRFVPFALAFLVCACADQPSPVTAPRSRASFSTSATSTAGADQFTLEMIVRDFHGEVPNDHFSHPDFESAIGDDRGLVATQIGPDRTPEFAAARSLTVTSSATFHEWWHNSTRNEYTRLPLVLAAVGPMQPGYYEYRSSNFFPIDGQLLGNQSYPHNYHFTVESHALFTYRGGETITVQGDDDSWIFVNDKLVIDLGGVHGQESATVHLDDLGLVRGNIYTFDLFHAERHTTESAFWLVTNAGLFEPYTPYDPTPPSVMATVSGRQGNDGWYVGDATIAWQANDDESAITSAPCATVTVSTDTPGATYECSATSSGPTGHGSVVVRRDATQPVITFNGGSATYRTSDAISVACVATDATAGIENSDCGAITYASGALAPGHYEVTRRAIDRAGNSAKAVFAFDVIPQDTSPPVIEAAVSGPRSVSGWYTGDVSLDWHVSDLESPISAITGCNHASITNDTRGATFTCEATSLGGTAHRQVTIQRDATPPTIVFAGAAATYDIADHVAIGCSASDETSGVESESCPSLDADASALGAGAHALHATATDGAGNTATADASFTVVVSYDGVASLVRRWVSDVAIASSLLSKIDNASRVAAKNPNAARNMLDAFANEVRAQSGKKLSAADAELLLRYARLLGQ